jgi:hypothetical protein
LLISSEIQIETKKELGTPCRFIIASAGEGWRYQEGSLTEPGTVITLTLNEEGSKVDLEKVIRHYVKSAVVPIFLGKDATVPMMFDWTIRDDDVKGEIARRDGKVPEVEHESKYEDDTISVSFYEMGGYTPSHVFIANQGFFVQGVEGFSGFPAGRKVVLINLKRNLLDITVSRDSVVFKGSRYEAFLDKLFRILADFADKEFAKQNSEGSIILETLLANSIFSSYSLSIEARVSDEDYREGFDHSKLPPSLWEVIFRRIPLLGLTDKGVEKLYLSDIAARSLTRINLYELISVEDYLCRDLKHVEKEVELLRSVLAGKLGATEIVLLHGGRTSYAYGVLLKAILKSISCLSDDQLRQLDVYKITNQKLKKRSTPIDYLLPKGCFFADFPRCLRGAVTCVQPYVVSGHFETDGDVSEPRLYEMLTEILLGEPMSSEIDYQVVSDDQIAFDAEDGLNKLLIAEAGKIKGNAPLEQFIQHFFAERILSHVEDFGIDFSSSSLRVTEVLSFIGHLDKLQEIRDSRGDLTDYLPYRNVGEMIRVRR